GFGRGGVFLAGMVGIGHVVGMSGVFLRLLLMGLLVPGLAELLVMRLFMEFVGNRRCLRGGNRRLDRGGHRRLGLRLREGRRYGCVLVAVLVMIGIMRVIVVIMRGMFGFI